MKANRRLVAVPIASHYLIETMMEGYNSHFKCVKGIPKDAVFISDYYDPTKRCGMLLFYHPSFKCVGLGSEIPVVIPEYTRIIDSGAAL